jgi:hypothetical protein
LRLVHNHRRTVCEFGGEHRKETRSPEFYVGRLAKTVCGSITQELDDDPMSNMSSHSSIPRRRSTHDTGRWGAISCPAYGGVPRSMKMGTTHSPWLAGGDDRGAAAGST